MGLFSFLTDTGRSIPVAGYDAERPTFTVYMVMPDGTRYREDAYGGYGVFGGVDFYEALAGLNGGEKDRDKGIDLFFRAEEGGPAVVMPRLTESPTRKWEDSADPKNCPFQGAGYPDDYDDVG